MIFYVFFDSLTEVGLQFVAEFLLLLTVYQGHLKQFPPKYIENTF